MLKKKLLKLKMAMIIKKNLMIKLKLPIPNFYKLVS